jgi:hypothetical protein
MVKLTVDKKDIVEIDGEILDLTVYKPILSTYFWISENGLHLLREGLYNFTDNQLDLLISECNLVKSSRKERIAECKAAVMEMDKTINKILSKYNLSLQEFV